MSEETTPQTILLLPVHKPKKGRNSKKMDTIEVAEFEDIPDELAAKIISFGVKSKQLLELKEAFSDSEMQKAAAITEGVIANGKLKTSAAGFFVSALKNHYEDNKPVKMTKNDAEKGVKKPKTTAETSPKLSPEEQAKADKITQRAAETRLQFEREKAIIEQLIEEDIELVHDAVTEIKRGMFGFAYNDDKTFAENRENKAFEAAFLNTIKKMRADLFK